jgi:hypothetical protein
MDTKEAIEHAIKHHDAEADFARAQRKAFESGEVYSLGGQRASDEDDWIKSTIVTFKELEKNHLAIRDRLLARIA